MKSHVAMFSVVAESSCPGALDPGALPFQSSKSGWVFERSFVCFRVNEASECDNMADRTMSS